MTYRSRITLLLLAVPAALLAATMVLIWSAAAMVAATAPAAAQPAESTATQFLGLSIDSISPAVGSTTNNRVSVTGTVSNVGDRRVSDISVRLQRGQALSATDDVRSSLERDQSTFDVVGPFIDISEGLLPGESSTFSLTLALFADQAASSSSGSLAISSAGMYPLLVNVNGTPDFGGPARLDDSRFLLPVISTPFGAQQSSGPTPTTLLWPLAAPTALVGGAPGSVDEVTLTSDSLAASLASGGRLDGLVGALSGALDSESRRGGDRPLAESVCVAIDPDLLVTVVNMTRGYRVLSDPDDPNSGTVAGVGAAAATSWLDRLRALVAGRCVIALPFGQTDLDRVAASGSTELLRSALRTPVDVIDSELDVTSADAVWPTDGSLDPTAVAAVASERPDATLVLAQSAPDTDSAAGSTTSPDTTTVPIVSYDPTLSTTLADMGAQAIATPDEAGSVSVTPASLAARIQNSTAATYWHVFSQDTVRPQLIAPPQIWQADSTGAGAVLGALTAQFTAGRMEPRSLIEAADTATTPPASVGDTGGAGASTPANGSEPTTGSGATGDDTDTGPDLAVRRVAQIGSRISDLRAAMSGDTQVPPSPDQFVAPLWEDLVRSLATTSGAGTTEGDQRIDAVDAELNTLVDSVSVVAPGGVFTLASEQSPMLLVARNDLPVPIVVALRFDLPDGITVGDIGLQQLPARGSRSLQLPVQIADSRSLQVEVSVTTPTGTPLGQASTVTIRSSNYGTAFTVITVIAGAILLLLVGRRLWHRFRGTPDPADRS